MTGLTATCRTCEAPVLVDQCDEALVIYAHACTAGSRVHVKGLVRGSMVASRCEKPDVVRTIAEVRA